MSRSKRETEENAAGVLENRDVENAVPESSAGVTEEVAEKDGTGNVMYLGPTIEGVVRHGTVFKNGILPEKVKECMKELPSLKLLFVPADRMPEAVRELRKKSALAAVYEHTAIKFARRT